MTFYDFLSISKIGLLFVLTIFLTPLGALKIESADFRQHAYMPQYLSCKGRNISPQLSILDVPHNCKSLVLIFENMDPKAKQKVHWILYNIPANTTKIRQNSSVGIVALNDFKRPVYHGPCSKSKEQTQHYQFKLFALDKLLPIAGSINKTRLMQLIQPHIIETSQISALYKQDKK